VSKKLKKELQDQLEVCEYKLRCELEYFRKEVQPLKEEQRQLLDRLSEL
tara:strand:- start:713 stop:859 length:147 start_codon:yes stop_codon:yes gene_type:complete